MTAQNILAKSDSIIFQPGGVASGLIVTSWAQVQKFVSARQGAVIVYVDDSIAAAHVTAATGITDFQGRGEIRPAFSDGNNPVLLTVDNGATLKNLFAARGAIEVQCDTTGATPGLDWTYSFGSSQPTFYVSDNASIGTAAGATNPAINIPAGQTLFISLLNEGVLTTNSAAPIFNVPATATVVISMDDGAIFQLPGPYASGAGTVELLYDSDSLFAMNNVIPALAGIGVYTKIQTDTHQVVLDLLVNTANVFGALQAAGQLPTAGLVLIGAEGFGGTGGGGGGQGGAVGGAAGVGGGAAGGCQYQFGSFQFDLSHVLDVDIGVAGAAGAAGAVGGAFNPAQNGLDGSSTECLDATAATTPLSFTGSSGGNGGGSAGRVGSPGATYSGSKIPALNDLFAPEGSGFVAAGGFGGLAGANGVNGQTSFVSFGSASWAGGIGGANAGQGGGGGGGGAGPFLNGAAGGAGTAAAGNPGGNATANAGNGAGGGGGGAPGFAGGAGGAGGTGRIRLKIIVP